MASASPQWGPMDALPDEMAPTTPAAAAAVLHVRPQGLGSRVHGFALSFPCQRPGVPLAVSACLVDKEGLKALSIVCPAQSSRLNALAVDA